MTTTRTASVIAAACAVLYLLVLPALSHRTDRAQNVLWLVGVLVAVTGITALVVAFRTRHGSTPVDMTEAPR